MLRKPVTPSRGLLAIGMRSATRQMKARIMGAPWATPGEFIEVWSRRNQRRRDAAGRRSIRASTRTGDLRCLLVLENPHRKNEIALAAEAR
jgi:hypothetical protein